MAPRGRGIYNRKLKMMEEDPHCWFCGVELTWECPEGVRPPNLATFDHIYQRCNPDVPKVHRPYMDGRLVCKGCNDTRGRWGLAITRNGMRRKVMERVT